MLVAGKTTLLRTLAGKYQKDTSLKVCGSLLATCTSLVLLRSIRGINRHYKSSKCGSTSPWM